ETYGVMVYQEQIIQIAHHLAGLTLGQADLLRRAVSKKKRGDLEKYGKLFMEALQERGYSREVADALYEQIIRFANYGFNKCHATPYAKVAYQTAYLKRHYPVEYMAALMNSVLGAESKVALYMEECRRLSIAVLPPDVNSSMARFTPDGRAIRFALGAVKNIGWGAVDAIVEAREEGGPFAGLRDLCERVDIRHLNRKAVESLIMAGAFDQVAPPGGRPAYRSQMLEVLDRVLDEAHKLQRHRQAGQMSLFDLGVQATVGGGPDLLPEIPEFPPQRLLAMEKEVLGFYVSGHPLRQYQAAIESHGCVPIATLPEQQDGARVTAGGILAGLKQVTTRSGSNMAFLTLEDQTGQVEVVLFPRVLTAAARLLKPDQPLLVRGKLQVQEEEAKLLADEVLLLTDGPATAAPAAPRPTPVAQAAPQPEAEPAAAEEPDPGPVSAGPEEPGDNPAFIYLRVAATGEDAPLMRRIERVLSKFPGPTRVRIKMEPKGVWIEVHEHLRVSVVPELIQALTKLVGESSIVIK
ncbi:MAG: OB-fold nucleic acid binding domain-containing protein, partial [Bacillota bacterium]